MISNHSTFRIIIKQNYIMKKLAIVTTVMLLAIFTSCKEKAKEAEKEIEEEVTKKRVDSFGIGHFDAEHRKQCRPYRIGHFCLF